MATNFPTSLDSYPTLTDNTDDVLAAHANDRGDAIEALEAKVGIDSSAVVTSVDYFLKHASGAYRTHTHDGTSDDGTQLDWDTCWADAIHTHASSAEGGTIDIVNATTGTLTTAKGGTGSTANANAASGVVVLDGSSRLPAVDGSQITTLSASQIGTGTLAVARGGTGITNFICKVVSYTGNGTSQNVAHGFGALPSWAFLLVTAGDTYPPGFWVSGMASFLLITTIQDAVATINSTNLVLSDGTHYNINNQTYNLVMFGSQ